MYVYARLNSTTVLIRFFLFHQLSSFRWGVAVPHYSLLMARPFSLGFLLGLDMQMLDLRPMLR